jgi:hypothetical protein
MTMGKTAKVLAGLAAGLLLVVIALALTRERGGKSLAAADGFEQDQSPLGGLFDRANRVSELKKRMGELRGVWLAMNQFAQAHQGASPTNIATLRPFLPANLTNLSDEAWEMPSGGMPWRPLTTKADAVLMQQKNIPSGRQGIVVFGDGHIEYKRYP